LKYEKDIILFINIKILEQIKDCVKKVYPNEACGLIFGQISEMRKPNRQNNFSYHYNAKKFECIESSYKSSVAFLMDDYEKLVELSSNYFIRYNIQLLSIFHSHPGSAYPSSVDIPYMEGYYKGDIKKFKHLIWTIMDSKCEVLNGFIYIFEEIKQIKVEIRNK